MDLENGSAVSLRTWALADLREWKYEKDMNLVTLKAHFDGKSICLDDPYPLEPDTPLLVTVVAGDSAAAERQAWLAASQASLGLAYGPDEPDYSNSVIREEPPGK